MAPIRVGLIGLSPSKDFPAAGTWTAATHLPALQNLPAEYEIVALANSTVESAKRSAAAHNLPSSVKTYGSPEDIAKDPDVDLVVVSVHVQKHYELVKPALLHGKKVLVEWPLAATPNEIEELTQLAKKSGGDTAVGVQGRASPVAKKLKEILASGQIGRVLSSTVVISLHKFSTDIWPEGMTFYLDISSGGNEFTISFGHFLDTFVNVLGDIPKPQATFKTHFPTVKLVNSKGEVVDPKYPKTSPDHILVQGLTEEGVVSSITVHRSKGPVDDIGLRWIISGTEGEVAVTGPDMWQMNDTDFQLQVRIAGEAAHVANIDTLRPEAAVKVGGMGANVASMYDAFARGDKSSYSTFDSAAKTHRLLDRIRKAAESQ